MKLSPWKKWVLVSLTLGTLGVVYQPLTSLAQKPEVKAEAAEGKKAKGRLPAYYSDIVTQKQRDKIYELQGKYEGQIATLADQIKTLQQQRDEEIEAVLSAEQRTVLEKARESARSKAAARKTKTAEAEVPATTEAPPAKTATVKPTK